MNFDENCSSRDASGYMTTNFLYIFAIFCFEVIILVEYKVALWKISWKGPLHVTQAKIRKKINWSHSCISKFAVICYFPCWDLTELNIKFQTHKNCWFLCCVDLHVMLNYWVSRQSAHVYAKSIISGSTRSVLLPCRKTCLKDLSSFFFFSPKIFTACFFKLFLRNAAAAKQILIDHLFYGHLRLVEKIEKKKNLHHVFYEKYH